MSKKFNSTEQTTVSNWSSKESSYQQKRDALLNEISAQEVAGAPFLYADRQLVTSVLTRFEIFKKIIEVPGAIVECGVHRANSLMLYYHLSSIMEPYNLNRQVIGFDTFEGFNSISEKDDPRLTNGGYSQTDYQNILKWAKLHDENRALSHIPKLELVKGDAVETIPKFVESNPHLIIALLYIDFDIYAPTCSAIDFLLPLVPKGGVVVFDELNSKKWSGETIALKEKMKISEIKLEKFSFDPWPSYYVVG
jgi:hypothetical protein